jgi:hypothetical protein
LGRLEEARAIARELNRAGYRHPFYVWETLKAGQIL